MLYYLNNENCRSINITKQELSAFGKHGVTTDIYKIKACTSCASFCFKRTIIEFSMGLEARFNGTGLFNFRGYNLAKWYT